MKNYGRLTLPTDLDVIDQTIALKEKLGAVLFEIVMVQKCQKKSWV